ncbi:MAG: LytTR family DNA-binding domain-containing protein [Spirosomataceae bacterium]
MALAHSSLAHYQSIRIANAVNPASTQYVILPVNLRKTICVPLSEVLYLEGCGNYTMFYFQNEKKLLVAKTIKDYLPILDKDVFVRTHKSFVVNLRHVETLDMRNMCVRLNCGLEISISRRKKKAFELRTEQILSNLAIAI